MRSFNNKIKSISVLIAVSLAPISSQAYEKLEGCFKATESCDAYRSIRKQTNPEELKLEVGKEYSLRGQNKQAATHYQIRIESAKSKMRWVETSCGVITDCKDSSIVSQTQKSSRIKSDEYLLALSWQPSFCESHRGKPECKSLSSKHYAASHLSLHGLWPQPRNNAYCNVSVKDKSVDRAKRWDLLKPLTLDDSVAKELATVMPGYASKLQRHEWIKHGTCYGKNENGYYKDSLAMTREVNESEVATLLASNVGKTITGKQLRASFDKAFGKGSGAKVNMRCDRKGRVGEVWINLKGDINKDISMQNLLKSAPKAKMDCQSGLLDPA